MRFGPGSFGATLKDDLAYSLTDCFETFPFPGGFETDPALEAAGQAYHDHRAALMVARNEGMTKTYNHFHDPDERGEDIVRLRELRAEMDRAVLRAYGWDDLAARAEPIFLDKTNEDDHTYQGRLFWPSAFRDEILARLLAPNAERHAEEVRLGTAPGMKGGGAGGGRGRRKRCCLRNSLNEAVKSGRSKGEKVVRASPVICVMLPAVR